MIEQERPDVSGHTLFCDDIRQEVSGKLFFIGVYQAGMFVNGTFPVTLPRLCFSITLSQKVGSFSPNVAIRIFVPGDLDDAPSIEAQIGENIEGGLEQQADGNAQLLGVPESERKFLEMSSNMQFENFLIREPGLIKVRADIGQKRYHLGSLRVLQAPQATPKS